MESGGSRARRTFPAGPPGRRTRSLDQIRNVRKLAEAGAEVLIRSTEKGASSVKTERLEGFQSSDGATGNRGEIRLGRRCSPLTVCHRSAAVSTEEPGTDGRRSSPRCPARPAAVSPTPGDPGQVGRRAG